MDSLFSTSFQDTPTEMRQSTVVVTSGDDDTDRAIDLAVDTLFVEEPDAPPPETMELEVTAVEVPLDAGLFAEDEFKKGFQPSPAAPPPPQPAPAPPRPAAPPKAPPAKPAADYDDVMAREIERHMRTVYEEPSASPPKPEREPIAPAPRRPAAPPPPPQPAPAPPARPAPPTQAPPAARVPTPPPAVKRPAPVPAAPGASRGRTEGGHSCPKTG